MDQPGGGPLPLSGETPFWIAAARPRVNTALRAALYALKVRNMAIPSQARVKLAGKQGRQKP